MDKSQKLFLTVCFFLLTSVFIYMFSGIVSVNTPRYYPTEHEWSTESRSDIPSMGYYGKVLLTLPLALFLSLIYYILLPTIRRILDDNEEKYRGAAIVSLFLGSFYFVAHEWHKWGITKRQEVSSSFFNSEFNFLLVLIILFLVTGFILLVAGKKLSRKEE